MTNRALATAALMGAMVCLATTFLHLPVPVMQGYVHLGDVTILLGALVLRRRAAPAAAVGSMLADLLSGFLLYAPATVLIKGGMALLAGSLTRLSAPNWRTGLVFTLCGALMAAGYFLFEWPLYGLAAAFAALPMNLLQGGLCAFIAFFLLPLMRRVAPRLDIPSF